MKYQLGDIVSGEVTGIQPYGAFVKLESGESGLIHISEISSLFVKSIEDYIHLNQKIKVKIIEVLSDKNLYRLSFKQVDIRRRQNVRKMINGKNRIYVKDYDFNALDAHLEEWIKVELNKIREEKL